MRSASVSPFPPPHSRLLLMAAAEGLPAGRRALLELFRRSGTSTPGLQGKVVLGTVVPSSRRSDKFVEVDTGFKSPVAMTVEELQRAGCATHVGARVPVTVEYLRTPLGEMSVSAERARDTERSEHIWEEIRSAHATGGLIKGRVLNPVNGGFAVGLAGLVAFMPRFKAPHRLRVGHLDWFEVMAVNPDTRNVVVASPRYDKLERALQAERNATSAAAQGARAAEQRAQPRLQRAASGSGGGREAARAAGSSAVAAAAPQAQQQADGSVAEKKAGRVVGESGDAPAAAAVKKAAAPRAKRVTAVKATADAEASGGAGDAAMPAAAAAGEAVTGSAVDGEPAKAPRKRAAKAREGGAAAEEGRGGGGETPGAA